MSFREFEYADGKSFKFWKIEQQGSAVVTRYGRIGAEGQETNKDFGTPDAAKKAYDKLVAEKTSKGYVEKTSGAAAATPAPAAPAKGAKGAAVAAPAATASAATGMREFEYADGKSFKFWKIELQGSAVLTKYGRIGADGQETNKDFGTPDAAKKAYDKLIAEKTGKGYVEKTAGAAVAAPAKGATAAASAPAASGQISSMLFATTRDARFGHLNNFIGERVTDYKEGKPPKGKSVFRIRIHCEEDEETAEDFTNRFETFLKSDAALETVGLVTGLDDMYGELDKNVSIEVLLKHADRLPKVRALFLGDILQEENEISWIKQADVGPILAAFPELEMLRIRGATGLAISKPQHAKLRALAIESGGLQPEVVAQICRAKFPGARVPGALARHAELRRRLPGQRSAANSQRQAVSQAQVPGTAQRGNCRRHRGGGGHFADHGSARDARSVARQSQ